MSENLFGEDSPVYMLRYTAAIDVLKENNAQKVIDFGCADLSFAMRLKNLNGVKRIAAVDVDGELLKKSCHKVSPLPYDFVCRRDERLVVDVFRGSVAERDDRMLGYDAVTCIEIIEHLEDDILKKLPSVIFGFIKPKVALFTTPNSDFNIVFGEDFTGFRHWDHKFEWTRIEFKSWCDSILEDYPDYTVEYSGIGKGKEGTEHLGCCSQMAVFKKISQFQESDLPTNYVALDPYELINTYEYPAKIVLPMKDQIYNKAAYLMNQISTDGSIEEEYGIVNIPLAELVRQMDFPTDILTEEILKDILLDHGLELSKENMVKYKLYDDEDSEMSDESDGIYSLEVGVQSIGITDFVEESWD